MAPENSPVYCVASWVLAVFLGRIVQSDGSGSRRAALAALLAVVLGVPGAVRAGEARVAVATNFRTAAIEIGRAFRAATPHVAVFSFGSTGQLYAQISQGAPFDVFLAADQARPAKAVEEGFAVPASRFTYALGRIVLFSMDETLVTREATLRSGKIARLAIAEPALAPYGAAAVEVLQALDVHDVLRDRIVRGINVAQAYQFVHSGNADAGFVALSQVALHAGGSRWIVPRGLHAPIAQDAVVLRRGAGNAAALAFVQFLQGPEAGSVRQKYGYGRGN